MIMKNSRVCVCVYTPLATGERHWKVPGSPSVRESDFEISSYRTDRTRWTVH